MKPYRALTRLGQLRRLRPLAALALRAYGLDGGGTHASIRPALPLRGRLLAGPQLPARGLSPQRPARALGCTRAFANAHDPPADALYGSMLGTPEVSETRSGELPA